MIDNLSPSELLSLSNVLFDIKSLIFHAVDGSSVLYPSEEDIKTPIGKQSLSFGERRFGVFTLQAEGAIKVLQELTLGRNETPYRWILSGDVSKLIEIENKIMLLFHNNTAGISHQNEQSLLSNSENDLLKTQDIPNNTYEPSQPEPCFIKWRKLIIDLNTYTVSYKESTPKSFSFETKPWKLLLLLFEHPRVVKYLEIAKWLDLGCYNDSATNADVAREVQAIRRDLVAILKKQVNMDPKDVEDLIVTAQYAGYKIGEP